MATQTTANRSLTVGDLLQHLDPGMSEVPSWPPDAFAVAASLLKHGGAYVDVVNRWPPNSYTSVKQWEQKLRALGDAWRDSWIARTPPPSEIATWWQSIAAASSLSVADISADPVLLEALVGIVAASDEACSGVGILYDGKTDDFDDRALYLLTLNNSLCEQIDQSRCAVFPKMHNPLSGMTIRSLTHNLALYDRSEVAVTWKQLDRPSLKTGLNILLLPWPLRIEPRSFREAEPSAERMPDEFGLFTFDMSLEPIDLKAVAELVNEAKKIVGSVDAVIFPELSMTTDDFAKVSGLIEDTLIIAGIGKTAGSSSLGSNSVSLGLGATNSSIGFTQHKHHRWRLDAAQMRQYGIGSSLETDKEGWWEAIHLHARSCAFFSVNSWLTFSVLICEDLARQDPVADLMRSVGPNLVIALLMDGPQLPDRWSARYATVLAEDPRSSVLTLTCAGMVDLTLSQGLPGPRSIALWKDALSGKAIAIPLDPGAQGVVLSVTREWDKEWTADGRSDGGVTAYLRLRGIHQIYGGNRQGTKGV